MKRTQGHTSNDLWVPIQIGNMTIRMFIDSGCEDTIITPDHYDESMGKITESDTNLRAWGATELLDVKGMIRTQLVTEQGARKSSNIYIVDGFHPEPLLGAKDAEDLGFITINKEGRSPTTQELGQTREVKLESFIDVNQVMCNIPTKVQESLNVKVTTHPDTDTAIPQIEIDRVMAVVKEFEGSVFDDSRIGDIDAPPIHFEYDPDFVPVQPKFHNIPINYQPQLSKLLRFLREQGVISDIDPRESYECIMNVVISDKKGGDIRMNIDNTPRNPGLKRTKFHVQTPQEIRHDLKTAKIFSEMDMGWAYHQFHLDVESSSKATFQTHEGIHKMHRLYFGPTASSGIFHSEVRKLLSGLPGVTSIHDNILVWGTDFDDHLSNLKGCLGRLKQKQVALKMKKSTFCMSRVKWFGRIFTSSGVTVDPEKLQHIIEAGRPTSTEDVCSLLMACQFNAKFTFDNTEVPFSYEVITAPLRRLLKNDVLFHWGETEETAYQQLITIINDPATLQPYYPTLETHTVADTSEEGIQGSIYQ